MSTDTKNYYVYVLHSLVKRYLYVGLTNNLSRRIDEHNKGKERTTKAYRPFNLIHWEKFDSRQEARDREIYLKSGSGKEWIKRTYRI